MFDLAKSENDELQVDVVRVETTALEALSRSEISMQIEAAKRWPRSAKRAVNEAITLATTNQAIAESCMYAVPRDGKIIQGESVRLAEMMASTWGNLHVGARVIDVGERQLTAQAVAWDLERNVRVTVEVPRNIVTRSGKRYGDAMIQTTGAAAVSIAFRNAVFRVIPKAFTAVVYEQAKRCAVGDAKTIDDRRASALAALKRMGATEERILGRLSLERAGDITADHLEQLLGLFNAIKSGELAVDSAFPALAPVEPPATLGEMTGTRKSEPPPAGHT